MDEIATFRACFFGLEHVYGTYDPATGRCWQVKEPVTDEVIRRHLQGIQPYGVYLLDGSMTTALVVDFDDEDQLPPLKFYRLAREIGVSAYIERSKSKGWHTWIFFTPGGVQSREARQVAAAVLRELGLPRTEVFPKQDTLVEGRGFGNFINAPLFGGLVPKGRTVFVDPENDFRVIDDQWSLLRSVKRVSRAVLDSLAAAAEPGLPAGNLSSPDRAGRPNSPSTDRSFGLPPCAQRMLAEGVSQFQRVACFRLAIHLRKARLPLDAAVACLRDWAPKNRPSGGKGVITEPEVVEQVLAAYASPSRSCGCEDPAVMPYCNPNCPLSKPRPHRSVDEQTGAAQAVPATPTRTTEARDGKCK